MKFAFCLVLAILGTAAALSPASPVNMTIGFREFSRDYHNYFRGLEGLEPLELDTELNIVAHAHAEKLAIMKELRSSNNGYSENLWAHIGPLRTLTINCRDAIKSWFTGSEVPGNSIWFVNHDILKSNQTKYLGIGVGTQDNYTVVVANYS